MERLTCSSEDELEDKEIVIIEVDSCYGNNRLSTSRGKGDTASAMGTLNCFPGKNIRKYFRKSADGHGRASQEKPTSSFVEAFHSKEARRLPKPPVTLTYSGLFTAVNIPYFVDIVHLTSPHYFHTLEIKVEGQYRRGIHS